MPEITPAYLEQLMRKARVANFRAQFDLMLAPVLRDPTPAEKVTVEIVMPAGELRHDVGRELEHGFVEQGVLGSLTLGRAVLRLYLLPDQTLDQEKVAVIRVCRLWARRSRQVRRRTTRRCARRAMARR